MNRVSPRSGGGGLSEELNENKGGRKGVTDGEAWGKEAFCGIPHLCPGAQKPLPGSKGQGKLGLQIGGGGPHLPPHARRDGGRLGESSELLLKVPLALAGPGPQGSERRVGTVPHPHHGDLEGTEAFQVSGASEPRRQELLDAPPTQPAPEDQGRWSSKEAGKGWEQAEYKAHISCSPSLAEQPPEAWPKITPR